MTALRNSCDNRNTDLVSDFLTHFDIDFAATAEQKAAVYGVRYNVYCLEKQFEPADNFPDRQERDEFDVRSLHCLITHKPSGIHAGCVRVVGTEGRRETDLLPFEKHCPDAVSPEFFRDNPVKRNQMCEVSRLAVDARFRKRTADEALPSGMEDLEMPVFSDDEVRTFPMIATAGFLAATALADISDHPDSFAFMEPFLPRLMKRAGLQFERAGRDIEYNGKRAAYHIKTQSAVEGLRPVLRDLYRTIHHRIAEGYESHTALFDRSRRADRLATSPFAPIDLVGTQNVTLSPVPVFV